MITTNNLPPVYSIIATKGRHKQLERVLGMALAQDYKGQHVILIYNNSDTRQKLGVIPKIKHKRVILINQHIYSKTGLHYTNLGQVFNDIIENHIPNNVIVNHMDDDDLYDTNHVRFGVNGLLECGKLAYKPLTSWYKDVNGTTLTSNVLEPSIFVWSSHLHNYGYNQDMLIHQKWLEPLHDNFNEHIFVDPHGVPTYTYTWVGDVFHVSGNNCPENYSNHDKASTDEGDGIITPL